jgi:uncharacterized protein (DUF433 family)
MQQFHPQPTEERDRELVPPSDPRFDVISINPARMSGEPCFKGTRVPVQNLWDHIQGGESIEVFLEGFEGITREQVQTVLRMAKERLLDGLPQP